jgi:putative tricarboxylic transport membrane protein
MLVTKGDGKYKDLKTMMDDVKGRPGEVTLGVVGSAQFWEVVIGQFSEPMGLKFKIVPFNSAGKLYASVLGGHIDLMAEEPGTMAELIKAGKLKALLAFSKERVRAFPEVPATGEFGTDATMAVFRGIMAKKGTPEPIIQYLHAVFKKAMEHKFYANYANFEYLDFRPGYLGPDDSDAFLDQYYNTMYKVYKDKGWLSDKVKIRPE